MAGRPGVGTFITAAPAATVSAATYVSLRRGLVRWLRSAASAGLDEDAITALVADTQRELPTERVA